MKKLFIVISFLLINLTTNAQHSMPDSLIKAALVKKDTSLAIRHLVKKLKTADPAHQQDSQRLATNNFIFSLLFKFSTDERQLLAGAIYMEKLLKFKPDSTDGLGMHVYANSLDTYANVLYKAGRIKEAIKVQEQAVNSVPENIGTEFQKNLDKMRKRLPTW